MTVSAADQSDFAHAEGGEETELVVEVLRHFRWYWYVRSDVENYKYDQSRQYERQTVKSTRDTTLYGTKYKYVPMRKITIMRQIHQNQALILVRRWLVCAVIYFGRL